jgi:hypothetical protein
LRRRPRDAPRRHATLGLLALLLLLVGFGCRHRGPAWRAEPVPVAATVELLVIGSPREAVATRAVARELDRRVQAAATEGRSAIVLWLGTDFGPPGPERSQACPGPSDAFATPALAALAGVVAAAVERGAAGWGVPGPDDWRCGLSGFEAAARPLPYRPSGAAAVLRVDRDGGVSLASSCAGDRCELTAPSRPPLVELVLLDLSPWLVPELADQTLTAAMLEQQRSVLEALAAAPWVPRLLVSAIPVESAGSRGLGGRRQQASFRYLPEFLQAAIADGLFVGALGALERDLQLSHDLSNAIHRGDRSFVARPIFGVVSGAAGGAGHTLPTSRGHSLLPDLWSEHPGFVRLLITDDLVDVRVHARVAGRWREATVRLPLEAAPHPPLREPPTIQPCPDCDPHTGAADGTPTVPRGPRPR